MCAIVTIPNRPADGDTRSIAQILADFDAITAQVNGNLDGANVHSSLVGRRLIGEAEITLPGGTAQGTYWPTSSGSVYASGVGDTFISPMWWYLDGSKYAVPSRTTQLIVRSLVAVNGVAPGAITLATQLNAVTFSGGVIAGQIILTAGAVAATVSPAVPAINSSTVAESAPVAFPALAPYAPFVVLGGAAIAANSIVVITYQLFVVNT